MGWLSTLLGISDQQILVKLLRILLVSITLPLLLFFVKRVYDEYAKDRRRRRDTYAEALLACIEYREYVFVIHRRGKKDKEAERLRISGELMQVQKRIGYYTSWLSTESKTVAKAYDLLVKRSREVAGSEMKKMWANDPVASDAEMTVQPHIDWKDLDDYRENYVKATQRELAHWWNIKQKFVKLKK